MNKIQKITTIASTVFFSIVFGHYAFAEDKTTAILDPNWQIEDILNLILGTLTVGTSILATGSIIFAGFLYMTAGGNSGQVQRAKTMIFNTVIGIIAYVFMWTLLEWLIPGGVF